MLPLIPYREVHPVSASGSQAYPICSHAYLLLSKLLPFCDSIFSSIGTLLLAIVIIRLSAKGTNAS